MQQKPLVIPAFHLGGVVTGRFFVDRTKEQEDCLAVISEGRGNLLLSGKRRIGKTSLMYKIMDALESAPKPTVLPVYVNLAAYFDRSLEFFLEDLLIQICARAGKVIFGKEYSEMLRSLGAGEDVLSAQYTKLRRVFELARQTQATREYAKRSELGVVSPVKAIREETSMAGLQLGKLFPYEFFALAKEIVALCGEHDFKGVVILADEANKIPAPIASSLLGDLFQVFGGEPIHFVFSAAPEQSETRPGLRDVFAERLDLRGFPSQESLADLLRVYYSTRLGETYPKAPFHREALSRIWQITGGHPFLIQLVCDRGLRQANARGGSEVTEVDILSAWATELQRQPHLAEVSGE